MIRIEFISVVTPNFFSLLTLSKSSTTINLRIIYQTCNINRNILDALWTWKLWLLFLLGLRNFWVEYQPLECVQLCMRLEKGASILLESDRAMAFFEYAYTLFLHRVNRKLNVIQQTLVPEYLDGLQPWELRRKWPRLWNQFQTRIKNAWKKSVRIFFINKISCL